jgi:hypothetical protein
MMVLCRLNSGLAHPQNSGSNSGVVLWLCIPGPALRRRPGDCSCRPEKQEFGGAIDQKRPSALACESSLASLTHFAKSGGAEN